MAVGQSILRVDAYDKVTGQARYTDDLRRPGTLVASIVHSTIANGLVTAIDCQAAHSLPGVVAVLTCFDVPDCPFPTAGHPWSTEPSHQDVADRLLLNRRVRIYGDDVAVVLASDSVTAGRAARLVRVEYEEYPALVTIEQALAPGATALHEQKPGNLLAHSRYTVGESSFEEAVGEDGLRLFSGRYTTQTVQHCHIEPPVTLAHMEGDRVVLTSSTQIPHIVRRVVAQATGLPFGRIRVIKPFIGGGFGNKQEVLYEPLAAWLTMQVGGRPVEIELTREETFSCTRVRHAIDFELCTALRPDGRLVARRVAAWSNQGGYASHGHAIAANAINEFRHLYQDEKVIEAEASTVYTNCSTAGAMRGYGIPQAVFALESQMDDMARDLDLDPVALRLQNCMKPGYVDPKTGIICHTSGLRECLLKGKSLIDWEEKRRLYQNQTGPLRRGVGMAMFSYKTGVYPISLETAACRMILNQDGTAQIQMGATEIGQGADTVFTQMAAQASGLRLEDLHVISSQDTDVTPFDTGAYASRQTYVSGMALKQTAELLRGRILDYAAGMLGRSAEGLTLTQSRVCDAATGEVLLPVCDVAMESFYSRTDSRPITAECTHHCKDNTFAFGACFAEVEVDIPMGKIKVLKMVNVHDSGRLINPALAEAQVHGGMSMALGYALGEQLRYDDKARPLNGNFLDYKLPTALDTPELTAAFVETIDPSAPFGNKALGEPPAIPGAPAIRNALLHATGVAVNSLPLNPQRLIEHFAQAGLLKREVALHV